jgi:hypothetical protein
MEKLVYVAWKQPGASVEEFRDDLTGERGKRLIDLGAKRLAVAVADEHVRYAQGSVITNLETPIAAIVSFWLDTHLDRAPLEEVIASVTSRHAGYLVVESVPIVNTTQTAAVGERTPGIHTIAFLEKPDRLGYGEWLDLWQGRHTRVAIETQSTFLYIQNAVVRAITEDAPPWVAIVEEGFPREALRGLGREAGGESRTHDRELPALHRLRSPRVAHVQPIRSRGLKRPRGAYSAFTSLNGRSRRGRRR